MHSLNDLTGILGRDRLTLLGWMKRFELDEPRASTDFRLLVPGFGR